MPSAIMHIAARKLQLSICKLIQLYMEHLKHTLRLVEPLVNKDNVLVDQLQFLLQFRNFGGLSSRRKQ